MTDFRRLIGHSDHAGGQLRLYSDFIGSRRVSARLGPAPRMGPNSVDGIWEISTLSTEIVLMDTAGLSLTAVSHMMRMCTIHRCSLTQCECQHTPGGGSSGHCWCYQGPPSASFAALMLHSTSLQFLRLRMRRHKRNGTPCTGTHRAACTPAAQQGHSMSFCVHAIAHHLLCACYCPCAQSTDVKCAARRRDADIFRG